MDREFKCGTDTDLRNEDLWSVMEEYRDMLPSEFKSLESLVHIVRTLLCSVASALEFIT